MQFLAAVPSIGTLSPLCASEHPLPSGKAADAEIVIVGSGAAGLSAALSASENGARKIQIIEKMPLLGGVTRVSCGYFNAADPVRQKQMGIEDSMQLHRAHTLLSARGKANPELINILCTNALDTLHWLEGYGIRYADRCTQIYGALFPRGHVPVLYGNYTSYVDILGDRCRERGIEIRTNLKVSKILKSENGVYGVEAKPSRGEPIQITASKAVILAAGGFASNSRLCCAHNPRLKGLDCSNPPVSTGEVLMQAIDIGAYAAGCDYIECMPSPMQFSRFAVFIERCIFVDSQGKRFIREDETRDILRDKILSLPGRHGFVIVDDDGYRECPEAFREVVGEKLKRREVFCAETPEKLAERLRLPPAVFAETLRAYNRCVAAQKDTEFGRDPHSMLFPISKPPFWGSVCRMSIHHTMGGVLINTKGQVLDWEDKPIPHLYAAGEITGGIHGANRLGGNAITDAHVFGRLAGRWAAQEKEISDG